MKKRFSILGDSISTFAGCNPENFRVYYEGERCEATGVRVPADTWWAQVIDHCGGELLVNGSFSGSMVEGVGFPAGDSAERVAALACDGQAPDAVLVFIGINDYGWGGADAQAAGRGNALPVNLDVDALGDPQVAGLAASDAAQRFGVAYGMMLSRMRDAYPAADIWCCTLCPGRVAGRDGSTFAYRLRGVAFDDYNEAIRVAACAHGCRLADVRALGEDYEALDGTHPTARGMRQLADMVVRAMGEGAMPSEGEAAAGVDGPAAGRAHACPTAASTNTAANVDPATNINATPNVDLAPNVDPAPNVDLAPNTDTPESAWRSVDRCPKFSCIGCPNAASTGNQWLLVCQQDQ